MTANELQAELGAQIRRIRIRQDMDQRETAEKAGVSERAVRGLETGTGSTLRTLVLVLKALNAIDNIQAIAPQASVSPMALLRGIRNPKRVGRPRSKPKGSEFGQL